MTTNGTLLEQAAPELKSAGLKRLNISLDTLSAEVYRAITGGDISPVMSGIEAAIAAGFDEITVNAVARPGGESGAENFLSWAAARNLDVKFIEEMPLGKHAPVKKGMAKSACGTEILTTAADSARPVDTFDFAAFERKIVSGMGLSETHSEGFGPGRYYRKKQGGHKIGFVAALSKPFCEKCDRLRLTSDGKLLPCLGHPEFADLRQLLRSKKSTDEKRTAVAESFIYVADIKPRNHDDFAMAGAVKMDSIGG
jgi:cyclic pyranopterin phosphate synthase